ncbi:MAG: hypothetical protein KBT20_09185 [Bacteroidales bacterium]|nr:hypothetical protein [Candidatus Liminaster caballi]
MIKKIHAIVLLITMLLTVIRPSAMARQQVGEWHVYQAYSDYTEAEVAVPDSVCFAIASGHLCKCLIEDGTFETYSRETGLNGSVVQHIVWCDAAQRLAVVYDDCNIDIVALDGTIVNMPDFMNKTMNEIKAITGTCAGDGTSVFLTTSFGIIEIDMVNALFVKTHDLNSAVGEWAKLMPQSRNDFSMLPDFGNGEYPFYNQFYHGTFADGRFLSVRGAFNPGREYNWTMAGGVQIFDTETDEWTMADDSFKDTLSHRFIDYNAIDIDPLDHSHYAVGAKSGLYEYRADTLYCHYTYYNSPIGSPINSNDYCVITGIKYDENGNLWVANWQAEGAKLLCLKPDGTWRTTSALGNVAHRGIKDMFIDSRGLLWMVNEDWNDQAIICYDYHHDQVQKFTSLYNQNNALLGGSSWTSLRCIAEDKDGNVWVGSQFGPAYIEPSQIYSGEQALNQYIIARNDGSGLGDYLLSGIDVTCICVDQAGRKWFGTLGAGVYLISADNNTQLAHFTTENSLLPSDVINHIAINPDDGCMYFLTTQGLATYQSDVTPGAENPDKIYCYPNPVRPDYNGSLTICNLCYGSTVTVTDALHRPLFRTETLSGTITWNLRSSDGRRVKPGVYYIYQVNQDGSDGGMYKFLVL